MRMLVLLGVSLLLLAADNGRLVSAMETSATLSRANSLSKLTADEEHLIGSYSRLGYMTMNPKLRTCLETIREGAQCKASDELRDAATVNGALRKLSPFQFSQVEQDHLKTLNKWSPDDQPHLYRVMGSDVAPHLTKWQPGQLYYDAAFVSTSLDCRVAGDHRSVLKNLYVQGPHFVYMTLDPLPEGSHGRYLNRNELASAAEEEEVMFEAGTLFCVLSREGDDISKENVHLHVKELAGRVWVMEPSGITTTLEAAQRECRALVPEPEQKTKGKKGKAKKGDKPVEEKKKRGEHKEEKKAKGDKPTEQKKKKEGEQKEEKKATEAEKKEKKKADKKNQKKDGLFSGLFK